MVDYREICNPNGSLSWKIPPLNLSRYQSIRQLKNSTINSNDDILISGYLHCVNTLYVSLSHSLLY